MGYFLNFIEWNQLFITFYVNHNSKKLLTYFLFAISGVLDCNNVEVSVKSKKCVQSIIKKVLFKGLLFVASLFINY